MAGNVNVVMFDKTGTITTDSLDFEKIVPNSEESEAKMKIALASCHSLTKELRGDPLEVSMFQNSGASFSADGLIEFANQKIRRLKQFPFMAELARSSTLIQKEESSDMTIAVKGAPEQIAKLCSEDSLPQNFNENLSLYTLEGYRVLALAGKDNATECDRHEAEKDLTFYGFVLFKNNCRSDSKQIITELHNARIRPIMVTGDNMNTAHAISMEAGVLAPDVPSLKVSIDKSDIKWQEVKTGKNFENLPDEYQLHLTGSDVRWLRENRPIHLETLLMKTIVFARMKPEDKEFVVQFYEDHLNYTVAFCGDGANDCRALKKASVGIALSPLEASAASPFTSQKESIQSRLSRF